MIRKLLNHFSNKFLSKWFVLLLDIIVVFISFYLAAILRYNFEIEELAKSNVFNQSLLAATVYVLGFLISSSYTGILRHSGMKDAYLVLKGSLISLLVLIIVSFILNTISVIHLQLPRSILLIHFVLTVFTLIGFRFFVRNFFNQFLSAKAGQRRVRSAIFGAGVLGRITYNTLKGETSSLNEVAAFIDDNERVWKKRIDGVPVYAPDELLDEEFIKKKRISQLIIAVNGLDSIRKNELVERCLELGIKVKTVPPVNKWISGSLTTKQIQKVKIEDLLERAPIVLDSLNISHSVKGKTVFVTGAAGSIGSEISRQLLYFHPKCVVFIDKAESDLHNLEVELERLFEGHRFEVHFVLGDITNAKRMEILFSTYRPEVIYHAAAYKHVPLIERFPVEGVRVNCIGTKVIADLAVAYHVEKFVMVSTDKAVNPTNVMGATKRLAEMYVQALQAQYNTTSFVVTRFGNVLGSNGSVLPLFRQQIERGGPLTITHPDITRYFMTIPEACNLVLEAGAMGKGGEIFVFDMGESVKVVDLARKMIQLSGLKPDVDIKIRFVGLRPGEKLYEELLSNAESVVPTHHKKIMIAKIDQPNTEELFNCVESLENNVINNDAMALVQILKICIPEYVSNNSDYSKLDVVNR
jgi:FlaA1/EpsC-like NDP-sugar epimerase